MSRPKTQATLIAILTGLTAGGLLICSAPALVVGTQFMTPNPVPNQATQSPSTERAKTVTPLSTESTTTVEIEAMTAVAKELGNRMVHCELPPDLPNVRLPTQSTPFLAIQGDTLTLSVSTEHGSHSLLPELQDEQPSIAQLTKDLYTLFTGDEDEIRAINERAQTLTRKAFTPVAILEWTDAHPDQMGRCTVHTDVEAMDFEVQVMWEDGTPARRAMVRGSKAGTGVVRTNEDGLATVTAWDRETVTFTAEHELAFEGGEVTVTLTDDAPIEIVLNEPYPEYEITDAMRSKYHVSTPDSTFIRELEHQRRQEVSDARYCQSRRAVQHSKMELIETSNAALDAVEGALEDPTLSDGAREQLLTQKQTLQDDIETYLANIEQFDDRVTELVAWGADVALPDCNADENSPS